MSFTIFRGVFSGFAGAIAALSASVTYASTGNHDLQIAPDRPQPVVSARAPDAPDLRIGTRHRPLQMAQTKTPAPNLGSAEVLTPAEIAGRSLNPGASDPDVPLPHPGLSEEFSNRTDVARPLSGPTPYGRGESGGGILGLRLPIPAHRGLPGQTTRSSIR